MRSPERQRGATAVEFALVLLIFLMFTLGIVDFARMLYTYNAATEAMRAAARYAVVCDSTGNKPQVLAKVQGLMPMVQSANLTLTWDPPSCDPTTCVGVRATLSNFNFKWIAPIPGLGGLAPRVMPPMTTYLTREAMRQDPNSELICP